MTRCGFRPPKRQGPSVSIRCDLRCWVTASSESFFPSVFFSPFAISSVAGAPRRSCWAYRSPRSVIDFIDDTWEENFPPPQDQTEFVAQRILSNP